MEKKINILFVTHYTGMYGANRSLYELILGLKSKVNKIILLAPEPGPMVDLTKKIGVCCKIIPFSPIGDYRWVSGSQIGKLYWGFRFLLKGLLHALKNFRQWKKVEKIVEQHDINVIYYNSFMSFGPFFRYKRLPDGKLQILHIRENLQEQYGIFPYFGASFVKKSINRHTQVIFVSNYLNMTYEHLVNSTRSIIIPNSILWAQSQPTSIETVSVKNEIVFGVFGIVRSSKGQEIALKAVKELVDIGYAIKLIIVGGGGIQKLQELINVLNMQKVVTLTGYVHDVESYYRQVNACLVCSAGEGFGRVTIEAMLHSKPIIGRMSGATPEILGKEKYGLLFDGTPKDLAVKIKQLLHNWEEGLERAKHAHIFTLENYIWPKTSSLVRKHLDELLK